MKITYRNGGRKVSSKTFFQNIKNKALEVGLTTIEDRARGAASAIVDKETGKHPDVFVRRTDETSMVLRTAGSSEFSTELERRLPMSFGTIAPSGTVATPVTPNLYLAHASEDKDFLARPLAQKLLDAGINVWLDEWEIKTGDSLRQKMEAGLENCTHFLVLLTPMSLKKAWVQAEIDVGFVRAVDGVSRFMGIRIGVEVNELSPFLKTRRCPKIDLVNEDEVRGLVNDIHGVSAKPALGSGLKYVKKYSNAPSGWSTAAAAIAEYLVRESKLGRKFDPQVRVEEVAKAIGLTEEDVRLGVLDLLDSGLVEESKSSRSTEFWPTPGLFVEFDSHFLDFDNKEDALSVAVWLINEKINRIEIEKLAPHFPDWTKRRLNSALSYLDGANLVASFKAINSGDWAMAFITVTDRTRRFVRDHG